MAVGQGVLAPVLDVAVLTALEGRLEVLALDRCAAHATRLRAVLALHAVFTKAGMPEATTATLALLGQTSEHAPSALLDQALLLSGLPGGLAAVGCGLLSEQQAAAVTRKLLPATPEVRLTVWARLQAQLLAAYEQGSVLPPGRLVELAGGWVIAADAAAAAARRKAASKDGGVSYKQREDGLVDVTVFGLTGPDAQAVLSRIRDRSGPWGSDDDRTDGARRRDAAVSLWLGRDRQPLRDSLNPFDDDSSHPCAAVSAGGARCGCRNGEAVPCGIGVTLLLPLGAALGTTDELAVLHGHGPIEPDLARAVLHNAPVIRPVWVDEHGAAVAAGDSTSSPPRGDPDAVRQALLALAASRPPR
ncbi:MAG: hypothetical protein H7233_13660, partial [Pseudorhodobacter sp.]|nr:hypothetical protein [Frankiaceae bacterium]